MPVAVPARRVTPADLGLLEAPLLESGYAGVYPNFRRGGWCAKPRAGVYLGGAYRCPRDAAADVVRWWAGAHGDAWPRAYAARGVPASRVSRHAAQPGWRCWRPGAAPAAQPAGYRLWAWVDGRERCVPPPHAHAVLFADAAAARGYYPRWRYDTFGLFAPLHLRAWA